MAEADLFEIRLEKLRRLETELGVDPYPARYPVDSTLAGIRARYDELTAEELEEQAPRVRVAGRLTAVREHGKSAFGDLEDGADRLQCHARMKVLGEEGFGSWRDLDLADFVGVEGELFRTRTGELTVKVESFALLSKALRPPPEKWHGLKDTELRYRHRYLDLLANPETREVFRARAAILRAFRAHLDSNGFIEVETPLLQPLYGGATARPFRTHHNTLDMDLYLRIAPELYLKRLLVGGLQRVYDLNRNFRNEGLSRRHNPEFTMLEFYAAYWDYGRMMDFAEELLCIAFGDPAGDGTLRYGDTEVPLHRPWQRLSFDRALVEIGGLAPELLEDPEALRAELAARDVQVEGLGLGGLKGAALDHFVEPKVTSPVFITDHPRAISPFSKSAPDDPERVERFELYIGGMEVANGYSELNDPREQQRRMREQVEARGDDDEIPPIVDEDYVRALEHGMPPAAGIGIGVDRIVMLATDSPSIRDVVVFPLMRTKS